jgi:hypothetical protein
MPYAIKTKVQIIDTQAQIQRLLQKRGVNRFWSSDEPDKGAIGFFLDKLLIKITVPYPASTNAPHDAQAKRSRWRALLLIVKARLEAVEAGISTVEKEFLSDIVTPDGPTVYEWLKPQVQQMLKDGRMPKALMLEHKP